MQHDNLNEGNVAKLLKRIHNLENAAPQQSASIARGGMRVHSGGKIKVEGTKTSIEFVADAVSVDGFPNAAMLLKHTAAGTTQTVPGEFKSFENSVAFVSPQTSGSGARVSQVNLATDYWGLTFSGAAGSAYVYGYEDGGWGIGNTGASSITSGAAGPVQVTGGLDVTGPKNFVMPHPTKPDHLLRHGATESPVSGTEYTGRATLDLEGEAVVTLPEYFEALNKPEGRTAFVTAVGKPFPTGASDIINGQLTVYGNPGQDVCWLVKAERAGADFVTEDPGSLAESRVPEPTG